MPPARRREGTGKANGFNASRQEINCPSQAFVGGSHGGGSGPSATKTVPLRMGNGLVVVWDTVRIAAQAAMARNTRLMAEFSFEGFFSGVWLTQ